MLRPQDVAVIKDIKGEEDKGDRDLILKGEDGRARLPVGRTPGRAKHWGDRFCRCLESLTQCFAPTIWHHAGRGEALGRLPLQLSKNPVPNASPSRCSGDQRL